MKIAEKIYRLCTTLLVVTVFFSFYSQASHEIYWQKNRKLAWEDFQGTPKNSSSMVVSSLFIDCREIKETDSVTILVNTIFTKSESWVVSGFEDDGVLWHAQKHFDIYEIYARKLVEIYSKTTFTEKEILSGKLEKIRTSIYSEVDKMHKLLIDDFAAFISEEKDKQSRKKWDLYIESELKLMDSYAEKRIKLPWSK